MPRGYEHCAERPRRASELPARMATVMMTMLKSMMMAVVVAMQ